MHMSIPVIYRSPFKIRLTSKTDCKLHKMALNGALFQGCLTNPSLHLTEIIKSGVCSHCQSIIEAVGGSGKRWPTSSHPQPAAHSQFDLEHISQMSGLCPPLLDTLGSLNEHWGPSGKQKHLQAFWDRTAFLHLDLLSHRHLSASFIPGLNLVWDTQDTDMFTNSPDHPHSQQASLGKLIWHSSDIWLWLSL